MDNIVLYPSGVWEYFQNHKDELKDNMLKIAESPNGSWEVWISSEDDNLRIIVTDMDDDIIDEGWATTEHECLDIVGDIYSCYLGYVDADDEVDLDSEDEYINQELISAREDEIDVLFRNMLFDLLDKSIAEDVIEEIADDVKEHTLEYIARRHGLPIYRPMYLEDEAGKDFYSEYPYEEMIFEDYNPIYEPKN